MYVICNKVQHQINDDINSNILLSSEIINIYLLRKANFLYRTEAVAFL